MYLVRVFLMLFLSESCSGYWHASQRDASCPRGSPSFQRQAHETTADTVLQLDSHFSSLPPFSRHPHPILIPLRSSALRSRFAILSYRFSAVPARVVVLPRSASSSWTTLRVPSSVTLRAPSVSTTSSLSSSRSVRLGMCLIQDSANNQPSPLNFSRGWVM